MTSHERSFPAEARREHRNDEEEEEEEDEDDDEEEDEEKSLFGLFVFKIRETKLRSEHANGSKLFQLQPLRWDNCQCCPFQTGICSMID